MDQTVAGSYARSLPEYLSALVSMTPWDAAHDTEQLVRAAIPRLGAEFDREGACAIHRSARVHPSAVITGAVIVSEGAVVGPHVRLRDGAFIGRGASLGASVEVKSSWIFENVALAHLNYVGNSVVGYDVNIEAGAVIANHCNERDNANVSVVLDGTIVSTGRTKFGSAIGPRARIGANAVTTPGTLLAAGSIVGRLELIDQVAGITPAT